MKAVQQTIDRCGLSHSDFAAICGVSRIMVIRYIHHGAKPQGNNSRRITAALKLLDSLAAQGKLPLPEGSTKERRHKAVQKIKAHLDARS